MWEKKKLGDVINLQRGYDLTHAQRTTGEFPVVSSSGITDYHSEFKEQGPGVITGRYGTLGEVYYVQGNYWPHNTTLFVENFKGSHPRFIYYLLQILGLDNNNDAGAVPGVNRQSLHAIQVSVPPLPLQRQIAGVLGRYDALLENYQGQVAALEGMAQELYREWFVRGRCPGAEAGSEGELPAGWVVERLGDVIELKYGKALVAENRMLGEVPVVGSSGIVDFHDEALVDRPGIVVGRKGNVGSVFWLDKPFYPIDTVFYVKSDLSPYYLFYNLQEQSFISGDAAVPGLNREQALGNKIVVPDANSLAEFDQIVKSVFNKISNLNNQASLLRATRDALLPRLLSGHLLPSALTG